MTEQEKRIPNILFVKRDDGGCGFFRCEQPANFIKRMGLAKTEVVYKEATPEQFMWADLVVFQEMGTARASNMANFCTEKRIPYICEFDDFVQHVSPNNKGGYHAWNPETLFIHRAMTMARGALALTVSTHQLAREYFPYNPNIFVVPNYLDQEKWSVPIAKKKDGKLRIGWMGGNAHRDDLLMISKVIEKIVKEGKGKVLFETMGMTNAEIAGAIPLKENHQRCEDCGYEGEFHAHPGESLDHYPMILGAKGWDIALAPVVDNSFGNAKSDLKIKEYAAVGFPIVASPVVPYREAAKNNAQILFAETFEEWYNSIKELIKSPAKRDQISRHNKEWVSQYWIQDNANKTFEVYRQVLELAKAVYGDNQKTPIINKDAIIKS